MTDSYRLGTVTSTNPLRVQLDGDTAPLDVTPINTFGPVIDGDRVWCQLHGRALLIVGSVTAPARDLYVHNIEALFTGGGVRSATTTGVSWSQRLMSLGAGRSTALAPDGYFEITQPPDTTVIPVIGHATITSVTVASGEVPVAAWQTLWYDVPFGAAKASDPTRFHITSYGTPFDVPPTWVPVVWKNGDSSTYIWGDGRETAPWTYPTLGASWVNYGSGHVSARYKRENGIVYMQGLIKNGTTSSTIFTLPLGYRPGSTLAVYGHASGGVADIRVTSGGTVYVSNYVAGGTNASVGLNNVQFPVDQ